MITHLDLPRSWYSIEIGSRPLSRMLLLLQKFVWQQWRWRGWWWWWSDPYLKCSSKIRMNILRECIAAWFVCGQACAFDSVHKITQTQWKNMWKYLSLSENMLPFSSLSIQCRSKYFLGRIHAQTKVHLQNVQQALSTMLFHATWKHVAAVGVCSERWWVVQTIQFKTRDSRELNPSFQENKRAQQEEKIGLEFGRKRREQKATEKRSSFWVECVRESPCGKMLDDVASVRDEHSLHYFCVIIIINIILILILLFSSSFMQDKGGFKINSGQLLRIQVQIILELFTSPSLRMKWMDLWVCARHLIRLTHCFTKENVWTQPD